MAGGKSPVRQDTPRISRPPHTQEREMSETVDRVLTELDSLAENWAVENRMQAIAEKLAEAPTEKRAASILAMFELAFAEGYYRAALSRPSEQEWGG
jgi:hypothetical protein